jgi:phospholipid/cholesterol/gamma-HCH transport system permease protein
MAAWHFRQEAGTGVIELAGNWTARANETRAPELTRICKKAAVRRLSFDVSRLGQWDTLLVAFLWEVKQAATSAGATFDDAELPASARRLLELLPARRGQHRPRGLHGRPPLAWIGGKVIGALAEVGANVQLVVAVAVAFGRLILGRASLRLTDLLTDLLSAGPKALAVAGVVNFLIGAILAYIGAAELRPFGAESYVPSLVGIGSVREISSVMTAIVMAGRTGGAYAARIASMQGNDEIAALETLGIPLGDFLLLPPVASLCLMLPILYLLGCFIAILGGLVVFTTTVGSAAEYLRQTLQAVPLSDFAFGLIKSFAFAVLIGTTSCRIGLRSRSSAAAVGEAATRAVVTNIVGIVALDAVFAAIAGAYPF